LERIAASHRSGLLDHGLAFTLLARHVVWWHVMCEHITAEQLEYVAPLKNLAAELGDKRLLAWARGSFLPSLPPPAAAETLKATASEST
jgi:hypothetical protein